MALVESHHASARVALEREKSIAMTLADAAKKTLDVDAQIREALNNQRGNITETVTKLVERQAGIARVALKEDNEKLENEMMQSLLGVLEQAKAVEQRVISATERLETMRELNSVVKTVNYTRFLEMKEQLTTASTVVVQPRPLNDNIY